MRSGLRWRNIQVVDITQKSKSTLISLLTDANDIGYRSVEGVIRRNSKGEKILDHEPIVEQDLFDLSYYPLAKTDLDGKPILDGKRPKRYFHHGSKGDYGLLKFRIRSNQGEVRAHVAGNYDHGHPETGAYCIVYDECPNALEHRVTATAIPCDEIDTIIVNRLMEHVREISREQESIAEYEKTAAKQRAERQRKIKQIENSIKDIDRDQGGLIRSLGSVEAEIAEAEEKGDEEKKILKQRRKQLIGDELDKLEQERQKLIQAKTDSEAEAESDLGSLDAELQNLEALWLQYTFEKRRSLINFIVKEVVIDTVSTHGIRIQVLWLHESWGREEMYYRRRIGTRKEWTLEEDVILQANYPTMPKPDLMALLPERGWESVISRAVGLGIPRQLQGRPSGKTVGGNKHDSYSDQEFMRKNNIPQTTNYTNWIRLYSHSPSGG